MRRWRGQLPANSAASRSGWSRRAPISRPSASASRAIWRCGTQAREAALAWSDPVVTGSEKTLATVWTTSVARLTPESRRLLDRLAFLAPDPIPDSLLDVAVPGEAAGAGATSARAGLYAYSLITRATQEGGEAPGFLVHRLVQDFARRAMSEERRPQALREALEWVNAAFVGDPERRAELANPRSARAARACGRAPRGRGGDCRADRRGCSTSSAFSSMPRRTTPRPSR